MAPSVGEVYSSKRRSFSLAFVWTFCNKEWTTKYFSTEVQLTVVGKCLFVSYMSWSRPSPSSNSSFLKFWAVTDLSVFFFFKQSWRHTWELVRSDDCKTINKVADTTGHRIQVLPISVPAVFPSAQACCTVISPLSPASNGSSHYTPLDLLAICGLLLKAFSWRQIVPVGQQGVRRVGRWCYTLMVTVCSMTALLYFWETLRHKTERRSHLHVHLKLRVVDQECKPNTVSQRKRSPWKFKGDSGVFKETQLQAHTSTLQLNLLCKPQTNVSLCYWTEMTLFIFTSTDAPWMSLTACEAFLAETRQLVWW